MASTFRYRAEKIRNVILEQAKKVERRKGQAQSEQYVHIQLLNPG